MSDIFLSYSHQDRERVRVVVAQLEGQKWSVWWDRRLLPGQQWEAQLRDELKNCVPWWSFGPGIRSDQSGYYSRRPQDSRSMGSSQFRWIHLSLPPFQASSSTYTHPI
jgi:TIR domain